MLILRSLTTAATAFALIGLASHSVAAQEIPLPAYVKESGKLPVATTIYAPFSYLDEGGKRVGLSIELAEAASKALGVEVAIDQIPFTSLIPSLVAGRIKIGWLNASVTEERLKQVSFVTWMEDGSVISTLPENKDLYAKRSELCGKSVAVQSGSAADFAADELKQECTAAGLSEIEKDIYPSQQDTVQAVITGRAAAYVDDATSAGYYSKVSNGRLVIAGERFSNTPIGFVIAKDDTETAKLLAATIETLMKNGSYKTAMEKYGMTFAMIDKPVIYTDVSQLKN